MIGHLEPAVPLLQVFDMQTSLTFYRDVLGFEIVQQTDHDYWAMLRLGEATLMLNTAYEDNQRPPEPDPQRILAHQDISLYFDFDDLDGLYSHLKKNGCDVRPPADTTYGLRQLSVRDPDGYEVCFTAALSAA